MNRLTIFYKKLSKNMFRDITSFYFAINFTIGNYYGYIIGKFLIIWLRGKDVMGVGMSKALR